MSDLRAQFGEIDIYLFDQILRRRIVSGMRVVDAGCGTGRNLVYLMRAGCDVFGIDSDPASIRIVQQLAATIAPSLSSENFRAEDIERTTLPDACADVVLSSAVLHFARDDHHFAAMLQGSWRLVKDGGLFFCRLASSIGMEHQLPPTDGRRYRLPDGSERYLVDEALLMKLTQELGGALLDPLKTTVVQNQRCMTTWVFRKLVLQNDRLSVGKV